MELNKLKLEQQIQLLLKQYEQAKTIDEIRTILLSLESLLELYEQVFSKTLIQKDELKIRNPHGYQDYIRWDHHKKNVFLQNFMLHRDFHYAFIRDIINGFDFPTYDYNPSFSIPYQKDELNQLLRDFCKDTSSHINSIYQKLKKENCIFQIPKQSDYCAAIYSDHFNQVSFIMLHDQENTLKNLVSLIHEISHMDDFKELDAIHLMDYIYSSLFSEVHSLKKEKEFYDYLWKYQIYKDEVREEVFSDARGMIQSLTSLLTYCKAPINYLHRPISPSIQEILRYQALSETNLDILWIIDNLQMDDFRNSYLYSYGELLAVYFSEYPEKYDSFRAKRYNLFDPKLFESLDITSKDIVKTLYKKYEKYS